MAAISIGDASVTEGSGTPQRFARFPITVAAAGDHDVTVHAKTEPGTVDAADFTAIDADVVIPAGNTSAQLNVPVTSDWLDEPDETFTVTLSAPAGAPIDRGTAVGRIVDDDVPAIATTLTPSPDVPIVTGAKVKLSANCRQRGHRWAISRWSCNGPRTPSPGAPSGTYRTKASGVVTSAPQKPTVTTYYRWVFAATGPYAAVTSATTTVSVTVPTAG